jgi:hypothetical protein
VCLCVPEYTYTKVVFRSLYQNGLLDGIVLDRMVQVERLVSCMDMLYEMIYNFVCFDELVSIYPEILRIF